MLLSWFLMNKQPRVIPDNTEVLVEFLLDTEAQEIEFQIAGLRPRKISSIYCLVYEKFLALLP
ncbi:hypothetical protein ACJIZ3_012485 [Penstemon smallii]|uniref:Uncharacterized protein n=1 Tax=Penstemon smallii TaxID=265156 RepID=A0ABD3UQF8_9LAMI